MLPVKEGFENVKAAKICNAVLAIYAVYSGGDKVKPWEDMDKYERRAAIERVKSLADKPAPTKKAPVAEHIEHAVIKISGLL